MSKIDNDKINQYIEGSSKKPPPMVSVEVSEWADALEGYRESLSEGITDDMTTEQFWSLIYFSALGFCRGMEYAEVKLHLRDESYYPRY